MNTNKDLFISSKKNWILIFAGIIIFSFSIRFIGIKQSLWLDEAIQARAVSQLNLPQLFTQYLPHDFNPPLSYILSWISVQVFGLSELSLRLPSILISIALVFLGIKCLQVFLQTRQYDLRSLLGSLLLASNPLLLYYSQEGRPYMLAAFLAIWSLLSFWEYFFTNKKPYYFFLISTILLFWSHYLAWFIWVVELLMIVIFKRTLQVIIKVSIPMLGIIPLLPLLLKQISLGSDVSSSLPVWQQLGALTWHNLLLIPAKLMTGRIPLDASWWQIIIIAGLWLLWLVVIFVSVLKTIKKRNSHDKQILTLLLSWLGLPVALAMLISFKWSLLSYFRFLYIVPAFYLLLLFSLKTYSRQLQLLILGVFLAANLICSGLYVFNQNNYREDWKGLVSYINQKNIIEQVIVIKSVDAPFWFYDKNIHQLIDYPEISQVRYVKSLWLIAYAQPIFEPDNHTFLQLTQDYGFRVVDKKIFRGDLVLYYLENPNGMMAFKNL